MNTIRTGLVAALLLVAASSAFAQGTVYIDPPRINDGSLTPGSQFTVAVGCTLPSYTVGVDLSLDYDPAVLKFVRGDLTSPYFIGTPFVFENGESKPGHYWLTALNGLGMGYTSPGTYTIVILTLEVVGTGATAFTLGPGDFPPTGVTTPYFVDGSVAPVVPDTVQSGTFSNLNWDPTLLAQTDALGSAPMPVGFNDADGIVSIRAALAAANYSGTLLLEVEIKPDGVPFDEIDTLFGTAVPASGGVSEVVSSALANGGYHWRCRAINDLWEMSGWVEFDAAPGADFAVGGAVSAPLPAGDEKKQSCSASLPGGATPVGWALIVALAACAMRRR